MAVIMRGENLGGPVVDPAESGLNVDTEPEIETSSAAELEASAEASSDTEPNEVLPSDEAIEALAEDSADGLSERAGSDPASVDDGLAAELPDSTPEERERAVAHLATPAGKKEWRERVAQALKNKWQALTWGGVAGFAAAAATRTSIRAGTTLLLGGSFFPASIVAGAVAGAFVEAARSVWGDRHLYDIDKVLAKINVEGQDITTRALEVAKIEQALKEVRLQGDPEKIEKIVRAARAAHVLVKAEIDKEENKDKPDREKLEKILQYAESVRSEVPITEDPEIMAMVNDLKFGKGIRWGKAGSAAWKGAAAGVFGATIAGIVANYFVPSGVPVEAGAAAAGATKAAVETAPVASGAGVDQATQQAADRTGRLFTSTAKKVGATAIKTYNDVARKGEGVTHVARRVVDSYVDNKGLEVGTEQRVWMEDAIKDAYEKAHPGGSMLHVGDSVEIDPTLLEKVVQEGQALKPGQIESIRHMLDTPEHKLGEDTIALFKDKSGSGLEKAPEALQNIVNGITRFGKSLEIIFPGSGAAHGAADTAGSSGFPGPGPKPPEMPPVPDAEASLTSLAFWNFVVSEPIFAVLPKRNIDGRRSAENPVEPVTEAPPTTPEAPVIIPETPVASPEGPPAGETEDDEEDEEDSEGVDAGPVVPPVTAAAVAASEGTEPAVEGATIEKTESDLVYGFIEEIKQEPYKISIFLSDKYKNKISENPKETIPVLRVIVRLARTSSEAHAMLKETNLIIGTQSRVQNQGKSIEIDFKMAPDEIYKLLEENLKKAHDVRQSLLNPVVSVDTEPKSDTEAEPSLEKKEGYPESALELNKYLESLGLEVRVIPPALDRSNLSRTAPRKVLSRETLYALFDVLKDPATQEKLPGLQNILLETSTADIKDGGLDVGVATQEEISTELPRLIEEAYEIRNRKGRKAEPKLEEEKTEDGRVLKTYDTVGYEKADESEYAKNLAQFDEKYRAFGAPEVVYRLGRDIDKDYLRNLDIIFSQVPPEAWKDLDFDRIEIQRKADNVTDGRVFSLSYKRGMKLEEMVRIFRDRLFKDKGMDISFIYGSLRKVGGGVKSPEPDTNTPETSPDPGVDGGTSVEGEKNNEFFGEAKTLITEAKRLFKGLNKKDQYLINNFAKVAKKYAEENKQVRFEFHDNKGKKKFEPEEDPATGIITVRADEHLLDIYNLQRSAEDVQSTIDLIGDAETLAPESRQQFQEATAELKALVEKVKS